MDRVKCDQILRECDESRYVDDSGPHPDLFLDDVYIPYTNDQIPRPLEDVYDRFKQTQRRFMGLNIPERHHRWGEADSERYKSVKSLDETKVDEVSIDESKRLYARKRWAKPRAIDRDDQELVANEFINEITCMRKCRQRHIIEFKESYTDETYFGIIMTPVGDLNLRQFMEKEFVTCPDNLYHLENFEQDLESFFGCLLTAMCYLRRKEIRHRDIKPENILVKFGSSPEAPPTVLVCDLGLAREFSGERRDTTSTNRRGTQRYKAPELVAPQRLPHKEETDVWSLGCVFVELHTVISGLRLSELSERMMQAEPNQQGDTWSYYERRARTLEWVEEVCPQYNDIAPNSGLRSFLIRSMLGQTPSERKSFNKLREMISQHESLVGKCCRGEDLDRTPEYHELGHPISSTVTVRHIRLHQRRKISEGRGQYEEWKKTNDFGSCEITLYAKSSEYSWETVLYLSLHDQEDKPPFWLPSAFISAARNKECLDLEWSDCKQKSSEPPDGPVGHIGRSVYKWEHVPDHPNNALCIDFEQEQDSIDFVRSLMFRNPDQGPTKNIETRTGDYVSIVREEWSFSDLPESQAGQFILSYVSVSPDVSAIREYNQLQQMRHFFLPNELDIWLERLPRESDGMLSLVFDKALEPLYLSNHPWSRTNIPVREVEPAVPKMIFAPETRIRLEPMARDLNPAKDPMIQRLFDSLSRCKLAWSQYAKAGDLMIWRLNSKPAKTILAFRWLNDGVDNANWITFESPDISESHKGHTIHVTPRQQELGSLINLQKCRAAGIMKDNVTNPLNWEVIFDSARAKEEFLVRIKSSF